MTQYKPSKNKRNSGKRTLRTETVLRILEEYPLCASVEEMCDIWGCDVNYIDEDVREYAEDKIRQQNAKLKGELKKDLLKAVKEKNVENTKALTLIYQLIGDEDDLRRLGNNTVKKSTSTNKQVIIKTADPELIDKLKGL